MIMVGLPRWLSDKESVCQCRRHRRCGLYLWVRKIPWSRKWQPTAVFLPGESHGQRSLAGYSSWSSKELDMTEHAHLIIGLYRVGTGVGIFAYYGVRGLAGSDQGGFGHGYKGAQSVPSMTFILGSSSVALVNCFTETVTDFILGGSKITADGDCSHEIKRCLLSGRKVMTNLDSILKSRDITSSTKVSLVKAVVFPVVIYGCEGWIIKKAECRRIDAFELWCWRRLLRVPWTARRFNQSILKEISPEYSSEGLILKLKLQYFVHLM